MFLDDVLSSFIQGEDDYLGLDHVDRTRTLRNGVGDLFLKWKVPKEKEIMLSREHVSNKAMSVADDEAETLSI